MSGFHGDHEGGHHGGGYRGHNTRGVGSDGLQPDERIELRDLDRYPIASDSGFAARGNEHERGQRHDPHLIGPFVRPENNYWRSHRAVVAQGNLLFNPAAYTFDRMVAEKAHFPAAFDPKNRHYKDYAALRLNVAVLRNYLANHFFPDGAVAAGVGNGHNETHLGQIGVALGESIRRNNGVAGIFDKSFAPKRLNVEGEGAALMYGKMLHFQANDDLLLPILAPYRFLVGHWDREWRLPPIAETPFDPRNLSAAHPSTSGNQGSLPPIVGGFGQLGAVLAGAAAPAFGRVEHLAQPVKTEAIRLARDILEKLKIGFGEVPVAQLLDFADPHVAHSLFSDVTKVAQTFQDHLGRGLQGDPSLMQDKEVRGALDSLGMLAYQAKRYALRNAESRGDRPAMQGLVKEMEAMPAAWRHPTNLTVGQLLTQIDRGMGRIVSRLRAPAQESDSTGAPGVADEMALGATPPPVAPPMPGMQPGQRAGQMNQVQPNAQALLHRSQQINAAEQIAARKQSAPLQASAPIQGAPSAARPPRPGRAPRMNPKPPRDALAAQVQHQQQQALASMQVSPMGNLVSAEAMRSMRDSMNVATTGEAMNPGKKAPKLYASKGSVPLAAKPPKTQPVEPVNGLPAAGVMPGVTGQQPDPFAPIPPNGHRQRIR